jgi:hypothetical protein
MRAAGTFLAIALVGTTSPGASTAVAGQPASAPDTILWSPDLCVPIELNGVTLRLAIDTTMPVGVTLNPDAALRAEIKPGWIERMITVTLTVSTVDPTVRFSGHYHVQNARIMDHRPERVTVAWNERTRVSSTCDGNVSVWLIAAPRVALTRSAAPAPTREVRIPMTAEDNRIQIYGSQLRVGAIPFDVRLDLTAPDTVLNAPAARRLVREGRLHLSGDVQTHLVRYGVQRPAERGQLIDFKPFGLDIPEVFAHGAPVERASHGPDEVAPVIVEGRPPKETARPAITLGYQALASCRSLTFDRTTHTITLACAE